MNREKQIKNIWHISIFVVSLIASTTYLWFGYGKYKLKQTEELSSLAKIVAASVNPDRIEGLNGSPEDLNNPDYIRLKEQLTNIANNSEKVRYIYLMAYDEARSRDKLYFLVDTQPKKINGQRTEDKDLAKPGEIYEETDGKLLAAFQDGKELTITTPETDKWGTFVSGLYPIFKRDSHRVLALVGVDYLSGNKYLNFGLFVLPVFLIISIATVSAHLFVDWITHKNAEDKIHSRMLSILKYSNEAIYSCDLEGRIQDWNIGAEKLYGYKESEIIGKPLSTLASEIFKDEQKQNILTVKEGQIIESQRTTRITKKGKEIHVALTISPMYNSFSTLVGISIIARDISKEVSEMEESSKKMKELEELNKLLIGRELKMMELKKKVKDLEARIK